MSVKRFTPAIETHHKSGIHSPVMIENKMGGFYRIDDYQQLQSQLAALKEENERLAEINGDLSCRCNDLTEENIELDIVREENRSLKARVAELESALDRIGGLSRALRSGGPDQMDLEGLSDALSEAVDTAHDALSPPYNETLTND